MNTAWITDHHLRRQAAIYIRQSTPQQVRHHAESRHLQYKLRDRAIGLGWRNEQVDIYDADQGQSGSSAQQRQDYKELVAQVALGTVGIILSTEVTRLTRNCSDWFPLLDVCARYNCLIADREGIYNPAAVNDRLLLGLKGQLSELELYTIQQRMRAGLLNKAKRGELALPLPAGYVRQADGQVVKDPDQAVQSRIELLFDTFLQLRSVGKTLRYLHQHDLRLPRRNQFRDLEWRLPSTKSILDTLKNPTYAGVFTYGRTRTYRNAEGRMVCQRVPREEWRVMLPDKYPAYISWATYEQIQQQLADNYAAYQQFTRGIPRAGEALLQGIAYCGCCGNKLVVHYKDGLTYVCCARTSQLAEPACQRFPGRQVDKAVAEMFLQALNPVELDLYSAAMAQRKERAAKLNHVQQQQLQQLRYQAALAERQYNQVDPDNRLVAATLEARWEATLVALHSAEVTIARQHQQLDCEPLSAELRTAFAVIGRNLPELWPGTVLNHAQKKGLLRCLIDKVVLNRPQRENVSVRVVWRGGDHSELIIPIPVISLNELSTIDVLRARICALVKQGCRDTEIADLLTAEGFRSPRDVERLRVRTVAKIRRAAGLHHIKTRPQRIPGQLTLPQVAAFLGVALHWLYYRINKGEIIVVKDADSGLYLFPDTDDTRTAFSAYHRGELKRIAFSNRSTT